MRLYAIAQASVFLCLAAGCDREAGTVGRDDDAGSVLRIDPALDALVPMGAAIERVATGFQFTEGPVWIAERGRVLFSDIPANTVYSWSQAEGATVFLHPVMADDAGTGGVGGSN